MCFIADINECTEGEFPCKSNERCFNFIGSFECRSKIHCGRGFQMDEEGTQCIGELFFSLTLPHLPVFWF